MSVHPDLASRVCEPFRLDRRGETKPGQLPYSMVSPAQFANGKLQTFYHSDYFRSIERHEDLVLTDAEKTILDFYDERGLSPELYLDMQLESGDIQFYPTTPSPIQGLPTRTMKTPKTTSPAKAMAVS